MDIQTQIEKAVTNGRGYNRCGSGFGKSETDSDAPLQARLAYMEGQSAKHFFGLYYSLPFTDCKELQELDNDLKNLGLKDAVTTPQQVEQALKIKRYLTCLVQTQIVEQAYSKEQNIVDFINFIKKKPSKDKIFMGYIPDLNKILDNEEIFYFRGEYHFNPLKKTKEIFLKNEKNKF